MQPPHRPRRVLTHHLPPHWQDGDSASPRPSTCNDDDGTSHPRLPLTHLVCPSTHDTLPSRRPHLLRHTHAYGGECHTNTHTLDSPHHASSRIRALVPIGSLASRVRERAYMYALIAATRAPAPSCRLTFSSQSPSDSLTHPRPLADPHSPSYSTSPSPPLRAASPTLAQHAPLPTLALALALALSCHLATSPLALSFTHTAIAQAHCHLALGLSPSRAISLWHARRCRRALTHSPCPHFHVHCA